MQLLLMRDLRAMVFLTARIKILKGITGAEEEMGPLGTVAVQIEDKMKLITQEG